MRVVLSLIFIAVFWVLGFGLYLKHMDQKPGTSPVGDVIIVLTGGRDRIEKALDLFEEGKAPILLISGVGKGVRLPEILKSKPDLLSVFDGVVGKNDNVLVYKDGSNRRIYLDYNPTTTKENALYTQEFIKSYKISKVHLVTANYHMARSLLEFKERIPGCDIYPHAVKVVQPFDLDWLENVKLRCLFFAEYHKLLGTWLRYGIKNMLIAFNLYPHSPQNQEAQEVPRG